MSLETMWDLARVWYHDRFDPGWRRKTLDEAHALLSELRLTGDFWRLA